MVNQRHFFLLWTYSLLWAIYAIHWNNMKIPVVDMISSAILGINLFVSFCVFILSYAKFRINLMLKVTTLLMLVFVIYGLVSVVEGDTIKFHNSGVTLKNGTYMVAFLRSFLPIFVFYYFTKANVLNSFRVRIIIGVYAILFLFIYFRSIALHSLVSEKIEFVNNVGYVILALVPSVFFVKKTMWQYLYWAFLLGLIFSAFKRGPIIIGSLLFLAFIYAKIRNTEQKYKIYTILFSLLVLCICGYLLVDYYNSSDLFRIRVEKTLAGNSSGRNVIVVNLLDLFNYKTSMVEYFWGLGADATVKYGLNYAHNDWVEILVDQGVFGVSLYFLFWFVAFRHLFFMKDKTSKYVYGFIMIDLFLRTIFSMTYSMIPTVTSMMLGYAMARDEEYRETSEFLMQNDQQNAIL